MNLSTLLGLIEDVDQRKAAKAWIEDTTSSAREAGYNSAGFDDRKAGKATDKLTRERDTLTAQLAEAKQKGVDDLAALSAKFEGSPESATRIAELETDLKAKDTKIAELEPRVQSWRKDTLRAEVTKAAALKFDIAADRLIGDFSIELGADDKLKAEDVAKLETWAKDEANKDLVKPPAKQGDGDGSGAGDGTSGSQTQGQTDFQTQLPVHRPTAGITPVTKNGEISPALAAQIATLPQSERVGLIGDQGKALGSVFGQPQAAAGVEGGDA
ncbi:hypothetical protein HN937_08730 [Candidatus Poribacteria bacterium]|jgi:hypothetical protein|nr:hypothetical protein [Candidatus Poribacteria bacterium]